MDTKHLLDILTDNGIRVLERDNSISSDAEAECVMLWRRAMLMNKVFLKDYLPDLIIEALGDEAWYVRANANLWLQRITLEDFGEVTRFTADDEARSMREKWRTWWKER